ncbi:O-antigen ligase family protein [Bradyrhizobium centrolobii]|nr:O-antigen ligase family protein [Bradyrhizobium centrolobii]
MTLAYSGRFAATAASMDHAQIITFLIIYLSLPLQLHDGELDILSGIFYTCLLPLMALTLSVLWTMQPADFERCMTVTSIVLCLFGISAIAVYGWPEGRTIGGLLHPNLYSAPLLAAFVFSQFRPGMVGIIVRILCFGMIALVSSRYALIGCVIALVLHEMTFDPLSPTKLAVPVIALAAGIVFWPQIAAIIALDDPDRGTSSGFTGRDDLWQLALDAITDSPFGVGFKRAIGNEGGHNGYLKLLVEFGVPGGAVLISLLAYSIVAACIVACSAAGKSRQQHRFDCARFGGMGALYFGAFFQPQVFSLGDAFAVSFMLLLFKPGLTSSQARDPIVAGGRTQLRQR